VLPAGKRDASRAPFVELLFKIADATDAFSERMPNGYRALHLYFRDLHEPRRPSGGRRGFYVVIWVDPVPRVRALFPKADLFCWLRQAERPRAAHIDL
jgi:hypothetical protein